jgi:hypothetical protein
MSRDRARRALQLPDNLLRGRTAFVVLALGASGAIGSLSNALSIFRLGFAATRGLSGRYPILILVSGGALACLRIVSGSRLTIAANGLATCVLHAVCLAET